MQRLITSNIIPSDHPIGFMPEKFQIRYLTGIGELLCMMAKDSHIGHKVKFCYDMLCESLLGIVLNDGWRVPKDFKNIKRAQGICRNRFHFFRMSKCFWWDIYRIAYQSGLLIENNSFEENFKKSDTIFSQKYRECARDLFYNGGNGSLLPNALVVQSEKDIRFHQQPIKKILVVGTMSAGKSTLVNALVGKKIAKVKTTVCTTQITNLYNNPFCDVVFYSDKTEFIHSDFADKAFDDVPNKSIRFMGNLHNESLAIIDTPGVDYAYDESHKKITCDAILHGDYDLLICVNNGPYIERNGENQLIDFILKHNSKNVVFVLNQLDKFDPEDDSIKECLRQFKEFLKIKKSKAKIIPFSAKAAFLLKKELDSTLSEYENLELKSLKKKFSSPFYDFGMYETGNRSAKDDYFARSGLTNLETTILNQ